MSSALRMRNLRWGWIVLGGFLAELVIFVIVIPVSLLAGRQSLLYSAPVASFIAAFGFGFFVARKAPDRPLMHGILVGLIAVLLYVGMSFARPEPTAYVVAHLLKVLGGALGGYVALKRVPGGAISDARGI
jgi:putative membrane protein (TIGR04086 family)